MTHKCTSVRVRKRKRGFCTFKGKSMQKHFIQNQTEREREREGGERERDRQTETERDTETDRQTEHWQSNGKHVSH